VSASDAVHGRVLETDSRRDVGGLPGTASHSGAKAVGDPEADLDALVGNGVRLGSVTNLPSDLDDVRYQGVDLDAEGLSGMTEQADSSFSKPNLGAGLFGPMPLLAARPSPAALGRRRQQLLDLAGDGQLDLDQFDGPVADASSCSLTNAVRPTHL
jgi:hypothetical protein